MSITASCTISALTGAEKTIRLLPAGVFRANDGRPAGVPGWRLTESSAAAIIRAAALRVDDFLIDYEHQSMRANQGDQPAPAAGWFKRLEWRAGAGLFAVDVQWTARASAMIIAREYRHISPVFQYNGSTGEIGSLLSAAITNFPAIDGLADIAAARRQTGEFEYREGVYQEERDNWVLRKCFGDSAPQSR